VVVARSAIGSPDAGASFPEDQAAKRPPSDVTATTAATRAERARIVPSLGATGTLVTVPVSPSDAQVVLRLYEAFLDGDENGVLDELSPDACWYVPAGRFAGMHEGSEAVAAYLIGLRDASGGSLRPWSEDSRDVAVGANHLVLIDRLVATRDGVDLDSTEAWVFEFRGGRIARVVQYVGDPEAFARFWS